jgi:antitoxin component YwqK of YwqJK toxin-antitoxin module
MKNLILTLVILISGLSFGQAIEPVLEAENGLVKATYHYENGAVQQVGYFKDGKLDGKWTSYDENGNLKATAEYTNGAKTGKWMYYSNSICVSEVSFVDNRIVDVKKFNHNAIADKD